MTSKRLKPKDRKALVMDAALRVARVQGYQRVTRHDVAVEAGVSDALVSNYWGTMTQLKRAIMRHAVKNEDLDIIAQGLAVRDPQAYAASAALQNKAWDWVRDNA